MWSDPSRPREVFLGGKSRLNGDVRLVKSGWHKHERFFPIGWETERVHFPFFFCFNDLRGTLTDKAVEFLMWWKILDCNGFMGFLMGYLKNSHFSRMRETLIRDPFFDSLQSFFWLPLTPPRSPGASCHLARSRGLCVAAGGQWPKGWKERF